MLALMQNTHKNASNGAPYDQNLDLTHFIKSQI